MKLGIILGSVITFLGCIMTLLIAKITGQNRAIKKELVKAKVFKEKIGDSKKIETEMLEEIKKRNPPEARKKAVKSLRGDS